LEKKACVIISGAVIIRSHAKSLGREPEMIAKYTSGDVLGLKEIDNGITTDLDNWVMTISPLEVIWLDKEDMRILWAL
jgi:hypothetical protein